jgi:hypothetical protein
LVILLAAPSASAAEANLVASKSRPTALENTLQNSASASASACGFWTGYWTWDWATRTWYWTWVWFSCTGTLSAS